MKLSGKNWKSISGAAIFVLMVIGGIVVDKKINGNNALMGRVFQATEPEKELAIEAWMLDTDYLTNYFENWSK